MMDMFYFSEYNRYSRLFNEVVKYSPEGYDENGFYALKEWTDFSDINKRFNHKVLRAEEYLEAETNYVGMAADVCRASGCKYMTMVLFQCWIDRPDSLIGSGNFYATENLIKSIRAFDTKRYSIAQFEILLRLSLRGYINCVFVNVENRVQIDIGYDYYMHILAQRLPYFTLYNMARAHNLYLNPRRKNQLSQKEYDQILSWLADRSSDYESKPCNYFCKSDAIDMKWNVFYSCLELAEYLNSDYCIALQISLCDDIEDQEMDILSLLKNNKSRINDMFVNKYHSHKVFDDLGLMMPMNLSMNKSYYSVYKVKRNNRFMVFVF